MGVVAWGDSIGGAGKISGGVACRRPRSYIYIYFLQGHTVAFTQRPVSCIRGIGS